MKIIYTPNHKLHNPSFEVYEGEKSPYPEVSTRIETIANILRRRNNTEFVCPKRFSSKILNTIHHPNYVRMLRQRSILIPKGQQAFPSYFARDTYAPITNGTYKAAIDAVNCALTGAEFLKKGEDLVYSLCRPPGHHSERFAMGGYCYFNNAAAAAEYLSKYGRVAILDIDFHHGNGTQEIFYSRDVLYVSLHADPNRKYPYISGFVEEIGIEKGKGYNKNYPLPIKTGEKKYRETLVKALADIKKYHPKYLVLSAGFDTYCKDPVGTFLLRVSSYKHIGRDIAQLGLSTLVVQEGGYYIEDLGDMATALLDGLQNL